jgi:hypothetical protein
MSEHSDAPMSDATQVTTGRGADTARPPSHAVWPTRDGPSHPTARRGFSTPATDAKTRTTPRADNGSDNRDNPRILHTYSRRRNLRGVVARASGSAAKQIEKRVTMAHRVSCIRSERACGLWPCRPTTRIRIDSTRPSGGLVQSSAASTDESCGLRVCPATCAPFPHLCLAPPLVFR